jgi:hypothetical protein
LRGFTACCGSTGGVPGDHPKTSRWRLQPQVPELTLDRTVRLLEAAMEEPELRLPRAVALVEYHIDRNKIAKASHDKTWKKKHRGLNYLRL